MLWIAMEECAVIRQKQAGQPKFGGWCPVKSDYLRIAESLGAEAKKHVLRGAVSDTGEDRYGTKSVPFHFQPVASRREEAASSDGE